MKSHMHKKPAILASAAFLLAAGVSVGTAAAYFTTYATASGGVQINLGFTTTVPEETVSNWTKHVKVTNTGDHECYVRVKAFAGEAYQKGLSYSDEDGKWTPGEDGYYYYSDIVPPKGTTSELLIKIDNMDSESDFNVIVVQESTIVIYDSEGRPKADWNQILDVNTGNYTGSKGGDQS